MCTRDSCRGPVISVLRNTALTHYRRGGYELQLGFRDQQFAPAQTHTIVSRKDFFDDGLVARRCTASTIFLPLKMPCFRHFLMPDIVTAGGNRTFKPCTLNSVPASLRN